MNSIIFVAGFVIPVDVFCWRFRSRCFDAVPDVTVEQLPHAPDFVVHGRTCCSRCSLCLRFFGF